MLGQLIGRSVSRALTTGLTMIVARARASGHQKPDGRAGVSTRGSMHEKRVRRQRRFDSAVLASVRQVEPFLVRRAS
jgi:hypothetical protein